jgi:hypothetical protein
LTSTFLTCATAGLGIVTYRVARGRPFEATS